MSAIWRCPQFKGWVRVEKFYVIFSLLSFLRRYVQAKWPGKEAHMFPPWNLKFMTWHAVEIRTSNTHCEMMAISDWLAHVTVALFFDPKPLCWWHRQKIKDGAISKLFWKTSMPPNIFDLSIIYWGTIFSSSVYK